MVVSWSSRRTGRSSPRSASRPSTSSAIRTSAPAVLIGSSSGPASAVSAARTSIQGGPQHDGVLGVEPAREPDPGIGAVPEVDRLPAGRARVDRVGVVPVHAAQPGDHRLELSDGSVLGKYQQVSDQGILPGRGDAGDSARVGVGDPARPHRRRQSRERGERAGDPDVVAGGALSKPAVVGQPSRGGRQPVGIRAVAVVELGDQQQPPARRRGHPPGESHDLVSEVQQRSRRIGRILRHDSPFLLPNHATHPLRH